MELASAIEGARHTAQQVTWTYDDGTAVDLTGATITGYKRDRRIGEVTALDGTLQAADAANGVFLWTYGENDVAEPGIYSVQFVATFDEDDMEESLPGIWRVHDAYDDEVEQGD